MNSEKVRLLQQNVWIQGTLFFLLSWVWLG